MCLWGRGRTFEIISYTSPKPQTDFFFSTKHLMGVQSKKQSSEYYVKCQQILQRLDPLGSLWNKGTQKAGGAVKGPTTSNAFFF